ncbi:MAG: Holliday junction resolvase RuvX [Phycisphaerales bacterium]
MRIVAIDVGQKRTGVAVGDTFTRIVSPREVIEIDAGAGGGKSGGEGAGEALLKRLVAIIDEERPARVVIGLPLNMDGTEGPPAKSMRVFAQRLAPRLPSGTEVVLHDERLSSADADWQMAGSGLTHKQKKMRRDALAAASILRGYLDSLVSSPSRDVSED